MAKKSHVNFVCNSCGHAQSSWSGKCSSCGEWNTIEESIVTNDLQLKQNGRSLKVNAISDVVSKETKQRIDSGDSQLNQVLGGGLVAGSVVLLAGQPGIGKSTILLQIAHDIAINVPTLYVSGEESEHQVASRASRLKKTKSDLKLASSTTTDDIARTITEGNFKVVVVDSIQTIACNDISSAPGSISQITNSTSMLTKAAKSSDVTLIIVGHVTKEGSIAGPKLLEHSVDVVLQIDGDRYGGFKILRSVKNRYGSTNEAAIYEMKDSGLVAVDNPSAALLEQRQATDGSVVLATMEGTRPLLVEIQALVNTTSYGYPKRAASGFDQNRLNLLIAMLERRTKLRLSDKDIYINVVGGIDVNEPAADLAICMAIASATKGMQLKKNAVVFGELGLSGEVRHVPHVDKRAAEAKKLGFDTAIGPKQPSKSSKVDLLSEVTDIRSALNTFLEKD
ncbi:MAG: DNA repair protein RadA [Candidatus Saccharibacteria bacterium]|nr:DNA repair protein RadA [Candidatus Saccharibacteria bacterium]